jgi:lysozyme
MSRLTRGGAAAALLAAMAIAFVGQWEGLRLRSYQDIVKVWTICYGETKNVRPGMTKTKPECDKQLLASLDEHAGGMEKCLASPDTIPGNSYVMFVSLTYNIGVAGFCRSSLPRLINAGDIRAACNLLPAFNRAGGRVVQGLVNRRAAEKKICLEGLQ